MNPKELCLIIQKAVAGQEILLPPGEYQGPLIIDKPLRLVGQGTYPEAVTIWTATGPAIIIRSHEVTLTNLGVILASPEARQRDVTVGYITGCKPKLVKVAIEGRLEDMGASHHSHGWDLPEVINFGELRANHPAKIQLIIEIPDAAKLHSELTGLRVLPSILSQKGRHNIELELSKDSLKIGTILAGQLVIQANNQRRAVWVIGRVVSEAEFARLPKAQLTVKPASLAWGKIGDWQKTQPKVIQLENSGSKAWQGQVTSKLAWLEVNPTTINCPANGKITLSAQLNQKIQALSPGIFQIEQALQLDGQNDHFFVAVQVEIGQPAIQVDNNFLKFTVDNANVIPRQIIYLSNTGHSAWQGTIRSKSWLQVTPENISCAPQSRTPINVMVNVAELKQGVKLLEDKHALEINGMGLLIPIQVNITINQVDFQLDFGELAPTSNSFPTRELRIPNASPWIVQGTVQAMVPWLGLSSNKFHCPARGEGVLTITLIQSEIQKLSVGSHVVANALLIEISGKRYQVQVQLKLNPHVKQISQPVVPIESLNDTLVSVKTTPLFTVKSGQPGNSSADQTAVSFAKTSPPMFLINPTQLDFKVVSKSKGQFTSQVVTFTNKTKKAWEGKVKSTVDWLEIEPTELKCAVGATITITVRLTNKVNELTRRAYMAPNGLVIAGMDKQEWWIKVSLTVEK